MQKYVKALCAITLGIVLSGCGTTFGSLAHPVHKAKTAVATPPKKTVSAVIPPTPASAPPFPAIQSGINVEVWGSPSASEIASVLHDVALLHVQVVSLVIPLGQSNWHATNVGPVSFTPSPTVVNQVIQQAYHDHLAVMLRPILDEGTLTPAGYWRGNIVPSSVATWFNNYTQALMPYATLARQDHVGAFDIGSELTSLEGDVPQWNHVIQQVQTHFQGPLLYSFNWNSPSVKALPSWTDRLTWIGLDAYFPLSADSDSVPALVQAWQPWIAQTAKIPHLLITEVGVMPKAGAWKTPWVWNPPGPTDWAVQAQYFAAVLKAWGGHSQGIYWWGVMLPRSGQGPSFDPIGHVSAAVIQGAPS